MKYLPLRELDDLTSALSFETADCRVVGSCDVYTTKAAGRDKKLYKNIEQSLESQYESLLRFSASLSPPESRTSASPLNLSRSSPFGSLSQISSRRIFAYLIATLNASHPDYDFSRLLRPSDFRRERSLKRVMNTLDTTLHNLRPKQPPLTADLTRQWPTTPAGTAPAAPAVSLQWGPKMWRALDREMNLKECTIYSYSPEEDDVYEVEDGVIWSLNYFFFNKARKRVCYLYLRGLSLNSFEESAAPTPAIDRTGYMDGWDLEAAGAQKRAAFWLGERLEFAQPLEGSPSEQRRDSSGSIDDEPRLLPRDDAQPFRRTAFEAGSPDSVPSHDGPVDGPVTVRAMSEEIAEAIEV